MRLEEKEWEKALSPSSYLEEDVPITHMGRTWEGQAGIGDARIKSSILNSLGCLSHIKTETKG